MVSFNSEFFVNNRLRLRNIFTGTAPIILTANGVLQQTSDNTFPFKQDSSFWYLTGIEEPDIVLVLDKNKEYLILPNQGKFSQVADGIIDEAEIIKRSGINNVYDAQEGWRQLSNRLKRSKHAAILASPPPFVEELGLYTNPARTLLNAKLKSINPNLTFLDIRNHIIKLRTIKQPLELEAINKAVLTTTKAFKKVKKNLIKFEHEYEIEGLILNEFRISNTKPAYNSIVASGKNACTLHYNKNSQKLNKQELVLIDIGADVNHYTADITRTYSLNSKSSKRQKLVHKAVKEVHDYALSLLKPGVMFKQYEKQVAELMGEKLRELGLINSIETENIRKFYPHSTSHFLGLDPHDVGDYTLPLEENMVITVEPGIYIPDENIGVRIEDDIVITNNGYKNLSASLPSNLD